MLKRKRQKGQGLIEYLILVCLVAVSSIWVVSTVGQNIQEQYANISRALTKGDGQSVPRSEADAQSYRGRGMDDFMQSARKRAN
jgi:type IV pilus assembly protein PilA